MLWRDTVTATIRLLLLAARAVWLDEQAWQPPVIGPDGVIR